MAAAVLAVSAAAAYRPALAATASAQAAPQDCRCTLDLELIVQRRFEPQQCVLIIQTRAVDQEDILCALAERIDLRTRYVHVRFREHVGNSREQPGPVSCNNFEDIVRSLVVGKNLDLRRQREVLQLTR